MFYLKDDDGVMLSVYFSHTIAHTYCKLVLIVLSFKNISLQYFGGVGFWDKYCQQETFLFSWDELQKCKVSLDLLLLFIL